MWGMVSFVLFGTWVLRVRKGGVFFDRLLTGCFLLVGLSRKNTHEEASVERGDDLMATKTVTNGRLFTEDELANAMTQSTLKPTKTVV